MRKSLKDKGITPLLDLAWQCPRDPTPCISFRHLSPVTEPVWHVLCSVVSQICIDSTTKKRSLFEGYSVRRRFLPCVTRVFQFPGWCGEMLMLRRELRQICNRIIIGCAETSDAHPTHKVKRKFIAL